MNDQPVQYVGFWARVLAAIVDTVLMLIIVVPILNMIYGPDYWLRTDGLIALGTSRGGVTKLPWTGSLNVRMSARSWNWTR